MKMAAQPLCLGTIRAEQDEDEAGSSAHEKIPLR
jgi:hypothetical protein